MPGVHSLVTAQVEDPRAKARPLTKGGVMARLVLLARPDEKLKRVMNSENRLYLEPMVFGKAAQLKRYHA